jgi:membrane-associated protein
VGDVLAACDAALHSVWLLPLLVVLIGADGPFPVLPSETLLMTASAAAFGRHDALAVLGLFAAALVGSVLGDVLVFGLGRSSHRLVAPARGGGLADWVHRHLVLRPGFALVGARFVPGGRLLSTAAAGRYGLPLRRFVPWSVASSAAWSAYMLVVGLLLGPLTGGNPLLSLLAGMVMAVVTAGAFAIGTRLRSRTKVPVVA